MSLLMGTDGSANMIYLVRKSILNPGPRFLARGLNHNFGMCVCTCAQCAYAPCMFFLAHARHMCMLQGAIYSIRRTYTVCTVPCMILVPVGQAIGLMWQSPGTLCNHTLWQLGVPVRDPQVGSIEMAVLRLPCVWLCRQTFAWCTVVRP